MATDDEVRVSGPFGAAGAIRDAFGPAALQGPAKPATVELKQPLGHRKIVDGAEHLSPVRLSRRVGAVPPVSPGQSQVALLFG
jgi:hypothetical protein